MSRWGLVAVAVVLVGGACKEDQAEKAEKTSVESERPKLPSTEAEFLELLAPVPTASGALRIRYVMAGPGGLWGELTLTQKSGGWRREDWKLRASEDSVEVSGTTIITPTQIWTSVGDEPGELTVNPLGGLAAAWAEREPAEREKAVEGLLAWRAELEKSRAEHPGDSETIQGIRCLRLRIAAQNLCMWEEAGLFLRYQGSAFEIEATTLERDPQIAGDTFELPARAKQAKRVEAVGGDHRGQVDALIRGDHAPIATLLAPGLRMPEFVEQAGKVGAAESP